MNVYAYIRISDGDVFIKHPYLENRWVNENSLKKFGQLGYETWTTELFDKFVEDGVFTIAIDEDDTMMIVAAIDESK